MPDDTVVFLVNHELADVGEFLPEVNRENMVAVMAEDVIEEREANGDTVELPPGSGIEGMPLEKQYPADIWLDAQNRWNALSPQEQDERTIAHREMMEQLFKLLMVDQKSTIRGEVFKESFGPFDLLWFGLAAFTAFKLGSGLATDE